MPEATPAESQGSLSVLASSSADSRGMKRRWIVFAVVVATMVAYFLPFLLLGNNSFITIHDTLDGEFVNAYLLVATGKALTFKGGATIDNIMNGLPRAELPSGLNVNVLLFYIFSPAWAYIVNFILVHIIAFCGMFLLLRKYIFTDENDYLLAGAVSLCFFLVPFYTIYGISVAGQPLLAYAFFNIRNREHHWVNYLIILFFPFWSDLALIAPFAVSVLLLIFVIDWARTRRLNMHFLVSIVLFAVTYLAIQYQLIVSILGSTALASHRTAWNRWTDLNLRSNLSRAAEMLLMTQYHSGSYYTLPIILAACAALVLLLTRKRRPGVLDLMAIGIVLICLEYGFYDWLVRWFGHILPGLRTFNAGRFYFLLPMLWLLLFASCLRELKRPRWGKPVVWCLIAVQLFLILKSNTEYKNNVRLLAGKPVYEPSFKRFFAADLFAEIDKFIAKPKSEYRVVSIGIFPSVALFNGFYTLDGYLSSYPLSYKNKFRKIDAMELDKNPKLEKYFDEWGNRCYVFSSELEFDEMCDRKSHYVVHNLQLDMDQLRAMGGRYIISAAYIENSAQLGLKLEKEFSSPNSFWDLYLYSVNSPGPDHAPAPNGKQNTVAERRTPTVLATRQ
jgi:hypothetical protein